MVTGNELIDSEHTQLFEAINALLDACASGRGRDSLRDTAEFLSDYVAKHFGDEEQLQKQYHYPHYDAHRTFHVNYKKQI
ncbi:hemerythrin domain-containing protein, partial [Agathobaculum ammoniilyticum]